MEIYSNCVNSSAVHTAEALISHIKHRTHSSTTTVVAAELPLNIHLTPQTTNQAQTQVPTVTAPENIIQAETNTEYAQVDDDEFINIFSTPTQERGETSSRHVDSSNMHILSKPHPSGPSLDKTIPLNKIHKGSIDPIVITKHVEDILLGIPLHQSPVVSLSNQAKYAQEILKNAWYGPHVIALVSMSTKHLDAD
ncbi:hypothetical protein Tco_0917983 [Tanacetum coccineum]